MGVTNHLLPGMILQVSILTPQSSAYFENPKTPVRHTGSNPSIEGSKDP